MSMAEKDFQRFIVFMTAPILVAILGLVVTTGSMAAFVVFAVLTTGYLRIARMDMPRGDVRQFYVFIEWSPVKS